MNRPRKFRKKPVEIEAMQWDGTVEDATLIIDWVLANGGTARYHEEYHETISPYRPGDLNVIVHPAHIAVETLDATARVFADDWMMKGIYGEFYPCQADVFVVTYESLEES